MNPCIGALDVIVVVFVVVTYLHCRCHPLLEPSGALKTYSFQCSEPLMTI